MLWHPNPLCLHSQRVPLAWEQTLWQTGEGYRWKLGGGRPVFGKPIGNAMILFDLGRKWHSGNCSGLLKPKETQALHCGLPLRGSDPVLNSMDMMCSGKKGLVKCLSQNMVRIGEVISSRDWLQVLHCEIKPFLTAIVFSNFLTSHCLWQICYCMQNTKIVLV